MSGTTDIGPFSIVPRWVREACKGKLVALSLYVCLADHADRTTDSGWTMGRPALAKELGVSTDTIDRAVKHLTTINALEVTKNSVGDLSTWSRYVVRFSRPEVAAPMRLGVAAPVTPGGRTDAALPIRTPIQEPKTSVSEDFVAFWGLYPIKKDKALALRAWMKMTSVNRVAAVDALPAHVAYWALRGGKEFIPNPPNPATWLNRERWVDEIAPIVVVSSEPIQVLDGKERNVHDGSWWSPEDHRWMQSPGWVREHPEYDHLRKAH